MESFVSTFLTPFRDSANSFLSQYEPIALLLAPLLALIVARTLQSFLHLLHEKGPKATLLGFFMNSIKLIPGVKKYIDAQKQKVDLEHPVRKFRGQLLELTAPAY